MNSVSITAAAYLSATIISVVLTVTYSYHCWLRKLHWSVPMAALSTSLWLLSVAFYYKFSSIWLSPKFLLYAAEVVHYFFWINAIFFTLKTVCNNKLPMVSKVLHGFGSLFGVVTFTIIIIFLFYDIELLPLSVFHPWSGLILSLVGVISTEQLYRNIKYNRYIKLMSLCLALLFIFDVYLYANAIVFHAINPDLVQARAGLIMAALSVMCIVAVTLRYDFTSPATLNFSRPIAFYSTSLSVVGGLLSILAISGYYIKAYSGEWGTVIYSSACFLVVIAIATL